jgi:CubicO group peptidase (beta-lactamase class C family)
MEKIIKKLTFVITVILLVLSSCRNTQMKQVSDTLPRSIPEAEGVTSESIIGFLKAIEAGPHEFHSFMFLRHGKVIAEGWWDPYNRKLKHTLYSASKSFTSTAAGFAVTENRLRVTDKVISFFPEYLPDTVSRNLADMEVRDLLFMSAGQVPDPTRLITAGDTNWVKAFLALPVINDPGTRFLYNSMATYMVSAIVQKVTGEKVIDYLTPRLFEPLNIKGIDWETDLMGINSGGWGLRLKTEDMAKFGQFYLQKGIWNGKQILPEAWIEEATTSKIDQMPGADQAVRDSSDWLQGYCYQFWRNRNNNGFRGDGAFGQFIIVLPEKDAVVAITAESLETQKELNLVWNYLLPGIRDEKLPENTGAYGTLKQMLTNLHLPLKVTEIDSPLKSVISGRSYSFEPNPTHLRSLQFDFTDNICNLKMKTEEDIYNFTFSHGKWSICETTRPGPNLLRNALGHFKGLPPVKVACSYNWQDENTLELTLRYIESPHTEFIICRFDGDTINTETRVSFTPQAEPVKLAGKVVR